MALRNRVLRGALLLASLAPLAVTGGPLAPEAVPEALKPWVPWVLYGQEERGCPLLDPARDTRRCVWPTRLTLELDRQGGSFVQGWEVYAPSWVRLPGDARHWPQGVTVDGAGAAVVERDGGPALWLQPGTHEARGRLDWQELPEALQLPADLGLLALAVGGQVVAAPQVEPDGRLWVRGRGADAGAADRPAETLDLRVFRRLVDEVPFQVVTRIELEVAGAPREVVIATARVGHGAIPLALESVLPARVEGEGRLRLQVRPGRWSVTLTERFPGPVGEVVLDRGVPPWPQEEVWVLDARPQLRLVEPEGLEVLDPTLTTLPADWQGRPTYRARPGERLTLTERRRGDPSPEPDRLALARTVWLDFDGGGATVRDQISGTMTRGWRLEAPAPLRLGRVVVDGQDRLVTRLSEGTPPGVEVRRGQIDVVADSRVEGNPSRLPAGGWAQDFQRVATTLNLPPGWRLLAAAGADQTHHAWLTRWTLFDLFLLLVAGTAVAQLWGWLWGAVALGALGLGYHEPDMPLWPWAYLLAAVALLRVLPSGRARAIARAVRWVSLVALVLLALPFLVEQVRTALYPALERPWQVVADDSAAGVARQLAPVPPAAPAPAPAGALAPTDMMVAPEERAEERVLPRASAPHPGYASKSRVAAPLYEPGVAIQAGPGLPRWTWEAVQLTFSGPVAAEAEVRLVLLPPAGSVVWRLLTVALLAALLGRVLLPVGRSPATGAAGGMPPAAAAMLVLALAATLPAAVHAEFPPGKLLDELRERLLAAPECVPRCAESPRLRIELAGNRLALRLEVLAQADVGVPLPRLGRRWSPASVQLDGAPVAGLSRDPGGTLWLALPQGAHEVVIEGEVMAGEGPVELSLPLRPRRVESSLDGWRVDGLDADGVPESALRLSPVGHVAGPTQGLEPSVLPQLLEVERTLRLGLEWRVDTRVARASPAGVAVVAEIPLVPGESVTTAGLRVERDRAQVSLAPEDLELSWSSTLARAAEVRLQAPATTLWTEVWRLDLGPTWHVTPSGIPPVYRDSSERWLPEWRPWPGEVLTLDVVGPQGVVAPTLTLEGAELRVRPGQRAVESGLDLRVRSTQGGQTALDLPPGAELQSATVDGVPHPVRQEGGRVIFPVRPGEQRVALAWREPSTPGPRFETPALTLGQPAVNVGLQVEVPRSRWVLYAWGPALGPAVLFWGVLAVVLGLALALGRVPLTPLRAWDWALLGIGLTQAPVWSAVLVVGWLLALGGRARASAEMSPLRFDLMQAGLALLTLVSLVLLVEAVRQGLLGLPEMQVAGNGSTGYLLRWYQDRSGPTLPRAGVLSVPLWGYRLLMLAWALWLAFALLRWLRWGWECYRGGALWRPLRLPRGRLAT